MCNGRTITPRRAVGLFAILLCTGAQGAAELTWFSETRNGGVYDSFADLASAYTGFFGPADQSRTIDFSGLSDGTQNLDLYGSTYGVHFLNVAGGQYGWASGVHPEGGPNVEDLTGYDGTYRPNGDLVYLKFNNDSATTPFTVQFDLPVSQVGAFLSVGKEGTVHDVTVSAYDARGALLGSKVVQTWLWDSMTERQNYESFFAVRAGTAPIARVEILNNSRTDFSDALTIDDLRFSRSAPERAPAPEPAAISLIVTGILTLCFARARRCSV